MEPQMSPIEEQKAALQQAGASGASWFYWIAGLSLINTVIAFAGGSIRHIVALFLLFRGFLAYAQLARLES